MEAPVPEWQALIQSVDPGRDAAEQDPVSLKLVVFGDSSVGKTSLMRCFATRKALSDVRPENTIGVAMHSRRLVIDSFPTRVIIWDTAGQEKYDSITMNYARDARGVVLVYDVGNPQSCANILKWLKKVQLNYADPSKPPLLVVLGNKADRPSQVHAEDVKKLFGTLHIPYFECSAHTGHNVEAAMLQFIWRIHRDNFERAQLKCTRNKCYIPSHLVIDLPKDLTTIPLGESATSFTLETAEQCNSTEDDAPDRGNTIRLPSRNDSIDDSSSEDGDDPDATEDLNKGCPC
jgi:small GTP-binding protein